VGLVLVDLSMSLDGFIAGPNDDVEGLHDWLFSGDTPTRDRSASVLPGREGFQTAGANTEVLDEWFKTTGAVVMGRRWFDLGERPWGDNPPFHMPVFVVTHRARPKITKGETTFTSSRTASRAPYVRRRPRRVRKRTSRSAPRIPPNSC
jgi:dihydrofolate reductase